MNVLVWLKRDLRVNDHPALTLAAKLGAVLPVYVVEPELWSQPDASGRQWEFAAESLARLREDLAAIGAPLVVRIGDTVQVLAGLCRRHGIGRIISHAEVGTGWSRARNLRMARWAREAAIEWTEVSRVDVSFNLTPQDNRAAFRFRGTSPTLPAPILKALPDVEPGPIPTARALRLADDPCPHRQLGGRVRGLELLDSFVTQRGEAHPIGMASPLVAERACSRLSPHLAWGSLSAREVWLATAARLTERPGGRWNRALSHFQASLAAREVAIQTQETIGENDPFAWEAVQTCDNNPATLAAWVQGETGLPFLDASLRYLRATGWLPAPLRAMVASVACWQFSLEERAVGTHLARLFTDYDPALLWPRMQALAAPSRIRLWNPVRLGQELGPTGIFIRRWLPELAVVPDAALHEPWRWPEARQRLGHRYPEPVMDVASATRDARIRLRQARLSSGFAETPAGFPRRSGSRSADRKRGNAQLSLRF